VTEEEVRTIADHLDMEEGRFIQDYTRLRPNRGGLALIDREDGACFFLKGNECSIQSVKPQQCKDFPNSWNFPGWRDVCEAIKVPSRGEE
jgi:Fe-S-cluster containining protein